MSHFRGVVNSMVNSLKEQYDQILNNTKKGQVTTTMVKFKFELDILAQYVKSQSIVDIDPLAFMDLLGPQPEQEETAANGNVNDSNKSQGELGAQLNKSESRLEQSGGATATAINDRTANNSNVQCVLGAQLKQENVTDDVGAYSPNENRVYPMVRLGNQPIYNDLLNGDINISGMKASTASKIPRRNGGTKDAIRKTRSMTIVQSMKRFQCVHCPRRYSAKQSLQNHVHAKHPQTGCEPERFRCDQCAANYSYSAALSNHKKKQH